MSVGHHALLALVTMGPVRPSAEHSRSENFPFWVGAVAAYFSIGGGVVADVFPPEERGAASGLFMIPLLVGPIVGPLLGGGLAQAFGWRSTFICLTVFAGRLSVSLRHYFGVQCLEVLGLRHLI